MVRGCGAFLNDQLSGALDRLHGLLLDSFHGCNFDVGPVGRFDYSQCVILVGFVPLSKWCYCYGRDYLYLMTMFGSEAGPVMCRRAGFKGDQTGFLPGQELGKLEAC